MLSVILLEKRTNPLTIILPIQLIIKTLKEKIRKKIKEKREDVI